MKKKNIFISIFLILILALIVFLVFQKSQEKKSLSFPFDTELEEEEIQDRIKIEEPEELEDEIILGDGFSILIPAGWTRQETPIGISLLVADTLNQPQEDRARQINFVSYYAVTLDSLDDVKDEKEYVLVLKKTLEQQVSNVVFSNEKDLEINANPAHALEMDITDNEIDFKTLIVVVKGKANDVWTISFNSTKSDWEKSAPIFEKIAKSFLVH